ncbi:MGMT family protein [Prochlorothrix hollandica]|uniref:MGMT family protein n=1 Tax=Prochlorothrix hollandica TaxID=1223 RepID=UPI000345442D|nr:MGMT family protein [Prochlorothrix hollandica]
MRQIPLGRVATYGQVATLAQLPGRARLVGYALFRVALPQDDIPWHRVINAQGQISQSPHRRGSDFMQRQLLEEEGIVFGDRDKISLQRYGWQPQILESIVPPSDP